MQSQAEKQKSLNAKRPTKTYRDRK